MVPMPSKHSVKILLERMMELTHACKRKLHVITIPWSLVGFTEDTQVN